MLWVPPGDAFYQPFEDVISNAITNGACEKHHPELLKGCEDMHFHAGTMYAACLGDFEMRKKWMPGLGHRYLEQERSQNGGQVGKSGFMIDRMVKWNVEVQPSLAGVGLFRIYLQYLYLIDR